MNKEQQILKKHQQKESNFYALYQQINQKIYDDLISDFLSFTQAHITFIKNLDDTVYVTDSLLYQEDKKLKKSQYLFESQMIYNQQEILNHMLDFYQQNDDKQDEIVTDFNKAQEHLVAELKMNKSSILKQIDNLSKKNNEQKSNEIKRQEISHKNEIQNQTNQQDKTLNLIQQSIKDFELKLQNHLNFMKQELKSINDNQTQIANQNYQEFQKQNNNLDQSYQKQVFKYQQQLDQEEKTYQNFLSSTESKNQTLLSRYEQNRGKQLETHHQKNEHYSKDIIKSRSKNDKDHKAYDQEISHMQENRAHEIKNMNEHIKKYQIKSAKAQHKVYRQEFKGLKKNYKFKLKSLHLR